MHIYIHPASIEDYRNTILPDRLLLHNKCPSNHHLTTCGKTPDSSIKCVGVGTITQLAGLAILNIQRNSSLKPPKESLPRSIISLLSITPTEIQSTAKTPEKLPKTYRKDSVSSTLLTTKKFSITYSNINRVSNIFATLSEKVKSTSLSCSKIPIKTSKN